MQITLLILIILSPYVYKMNHQNIIINLDSIVFDESSLQIEFFMQFPIIKFSFYAYIEMIDFNSKIWKL